MKEKQLVLKIRKDELSKNREPSLQELELLEKWIKDEVNRFWDNWSPNLLFED